MGNWVNKYRLEHADDEPDLDANERARLRELERTNSELKMEVEFLKKSKCVLRPNAAVSDSYEFIDHCAAKYAYPIIHMCHWLDVSRSGFYDWRDRPQSATTARRAELTVLTTAIFDWSDQTYGYRRVHHEVLRRGETAGPELIRDIMRSQGLVACQPRPWRHSLTQAGQTGPIPDLVRRYFTATELGTKLVGDITY